MPTFIDFRSDTITQPSAALRKQMVNAPTGDDLFYDDPTVNLLQEQVAELFGKEAAIFVPSGTMANLMSLMFHCP
jgi:threonine aldolase